jgi:hypothetical protein
MTTVEDVLRAVEEGRAAAVGAANPYAGQSRVLATAWLHGYRRMLRAMLDASPARRAYLRNVAKRRRVASMQFRR